MSRPFIGPTNGFLPPPPAPAGGSASIGGTITGGTDTEVLFVDGADTFGQSAALTFTKGSGTLSATILKATGLTATRVPIVGAAGILTDSAAFTAVAGAISLTSLTASSLTSGRVPVTGTAGLLGDDAGLTYATTTGLGVIMSDAATTTQTVASLITHATSGTAAAGFGSTLNFSLESGGGNQYLAARIGPYLRTATDASEASGLSFWTGTAGGAPTVGAILQAGALYGASSVGVGTLSVGTITTSALMDINSSMVRHLSALATQGGHIFAGTINTSGARQFFVITPSANTGSTAGTEINKFAYNTYTHQFASNTNVTTQRECCFFAPTYAFASATGTIATAATLYIDQGPIVGTQAAITKSHPLWIDSGLPRIDSVSANSTTACVLTPSSGPAGANTAVQEWLTIDINGTTRFIPCW